MSTKTDTATPSSPLVEDVRVAMRKAFNFGQTYWRQSDSESVVLNRASDETSRKFSKLVTDTCDALAAGIAQPAVPSASLAAVPAEQAGELPPGVQGGVNYIMDAVQCYASEWRALASPQVDADEMRAQSAGTKQRIRDMLTHDARKLAALTALAARQAPASTLTQSSDRALWTDEQRENHRKNKALVYSCTSCCARKGEPHLPSCSEGNGIVA